MYRFYQKIKFLFSLRRFLANIKTVEINSANLIDIIDVDNRVYQQWKNGVRNFRVLGRSNLQKVKKYCKTKEKNEYGSMIWIRVSSFIPQTFAKIQMLITKAKVNMIKNNWEKMSLKKQHTQTGTSCIGEKVNKFRKVWWINQFRKVCRILWPPIRF
jgi:hypothetical protein